MRKLFIGLVICLLGISSIGGVSALPCIVDNHHNIPLQGDDLEDIHMSCDYELSTIGNHEFEFSYDDYDNRPSPGSVHIPGVDENVIVDLHHF